MNSNDADFPMQLAMKYGLETRIGYDANGGYTEVIGLLIRFEGTSNLYNPSDAGQFLWGAWMRKNTFQLSNTIIGSNLNEISRGGDSEADQRAIINGYNYYKCVYLFIKKNRPSSISILIFLIFLVLMFNSFWAGSNIESINAECVR